MILVPLDTPGVVIERTLPGAGDLSDQQVHDIARASNDVLDGMPDVQWQESYVTQDKLYCVYVAPDAEAVREHARRGGFPADSVEQVQLSIQALEKRKGVAERAVEINRLENEADRIHEAALRQLFDDEHDAVMIIKWKEILDFLEEATDRCEDVANIIEGIVLEHA